MFAKATVVLCTAVAAAQGLCAAWDSDPVSCVRAYNVRWDDLLPETASTFVNTMPVGNGVVAANVWSDGVSKVSLLLAPTTAWNEASQIYKAGLVNITFPAPSRSNMRAAAFQQTLDLGTGAVNFSLSNGVEVSVWVDAGSDTFVVDYSSPGGLGSGYKPVVQVQNLRPDVVHNYTGPFECSQYSISADTVTQVNDTATLFYHRNDPTQNYLQHQVTNQNLGEKAYNSVPNKLLNRTTGGIAALVEGENRIVIGIVTSQADIGEYLSMLKASAFSPARAETLQWWSDFWSRSHVETSNATISRQFVLQRYVQALQARSDIPIKFNGMVFVTNKPPMQDYRDWGGRNWWQNMRLPYYNMLANGDADGLKGMLTAFNNTLPMTKAITQHYFNFSGAFWNEYSDGMFGTTHSKSYGCGRAGKQDPPYWWNSDKWNGYNWQGSLDMSLFALDYHSHTGDDGFLHIVGEVLDFYRQKFTQTDGNGNMHIYPSQAIETWQCPNYPPSPDNCAANDMPTVAGLTSVSKRLLDTQFGTPAQRANWTMLQSRIPPVPVRNATLVPCEVCPPKTSNVENAELYAVHPYRLFTVGRNASDLGLADAAFAVKRFTSDDGWNQNFMDAALLGKAAAAKAYAESRASEQPAPGYRFPAFMPHLQDYEPSADHLAVFNNGITYMILQEDDTPDHRLTLLPAWPCAWDLSFKLHGPLQTVVTGTVEGGKLSYTVSPASRAQYVTGLQCQN
ncbi:hypothetical protein DIPPA_28186 [Diplonema papillatum]|nr:hypothetical protein DIPPA_28186 [Diplonema papillatum]|eukprot:gene1830-2796_t